MSTLVSRRFGSLILLAALGALPALAQPPAAPAQGGRGGAGGGGGGGGGGRAGAVTYTPTQAIALARIEVPAAVTQAAATARTDLVRSSLMVPANPADLQAKGEALARAELALAVALSSELVRVSPAGGSLNLNAEQKASVLANNGLNRGGNTSPGGTFEYSDYTGYTKIFDGQSMNGWHGETDGWMVVDGMLQMDTARLPGQHHIHFTGIPGVSPILKDFDFKVEFKASAGNFNGGVQYRSRLLSAARSTTGQARGIFDPATIADPFGKPFPANITTLAAAQQAGLVPAGAGNPWQVSGYQFDITGNNLGSLYEGQGRGVIVNAGETVQLLPGGLRFVVGRAADNPAQYTRPNQGLDGEWNQIHIMVRGNTLVHLLNGHIITVAIDDDPMRRAFQGMLSLQCEGGAIWYRNMYLKHFEPIATR